jgi:hypothetical protein
MLHKAISRIKGDFMKNFIVLLSAALILMPFLFADAQVVKGDTAFSRAQKMPENTANSIDRNAPIYSGDKNVRDPDTLNVSGVAGYEDTIITQTKSYRETRKNFSRSSRTFDVLWRTEQTNWDNYIFRYNRVESVFLGLGTEKKYYWDGEKVWNAYGSIGWGFKSHTWRSNLGLVRQFAFHSDEGSRIIELGAEGYTLTDTKDQWIISQNENTASALLIHEDFRNYFERKGFTLHTAYYLKHDYWKGELKLAYLADSYDSLINKVDWAFFGGSKKFRANPAIDPGRMRSVMLSGGISTVTKTSRVQEGWCLFGSAEFAKKSLGGEFDFDQYIFDVRRFQPLGRYENFNVRVRVGTATGVLPAQKEYELGGLGTTNAFPFKSDIGNRMMLVNMELILNGNALDDLNFWPTWIFQYVNLILTSDAGFMRSVLPGTAAIDGFGMKLNEFQHDLGVALGNRTGLYRIGFAWRTDKSAPLQFILRFNRPF